MIKVGAIQRIQMGKGTQRSEPGMHLSLSKFISVGGGQTESTS